MTDNMDRRYTDVEGVEQDPLRDVLGRAHAITANGGVSHLPRGCEEGKGGQTEDNIANGAREVIEFARFTLESLGVDELCREFERAFAGKDMGEFERVCGLLAEKLAIGGQSEADRFRTWALAAYKAPANGTYVFPSAWGSVDLTVSDDGVKVEIR